jgi:1,4-dihydroxy-2-naphthoate octaprenyltransferase
MKSIRLFIQLSRPMHILSAILLYLLGVGVGHYLSGQTDWTKFLLGLAWVFFILLGTQFLNEYFETALISSNQTWKHTPFSGSSGAIGENKLPRVAVLWAGLTCLAIVASLSGLIIQLFTLAPIVMIILALILISELLYALPPFRLVSSGYGELIMSVVIGGFVPALAFLLQGHDFHRILLMVAFPLTTLHIAMLMALEFPDYASDLGQAKRPILVRIGWQRAMIIHNVFILGSFVILAFALAFGLPLNVAWPVFLAFPVGLVQIWMMNRIADGAKPNWNLLMLVSISTFFLTAYLLTFAFWIH